MKATSIMLIGKNLMGILIGRILELFYWAYLLSHRK